MDAVITLRPLDGGNRDAVLALRVSSEQLAFVSSVEDSLREAEEEPGGRAMQWALYDGEIPVGFVMISDNVEGPGYIAQYLWKLSSTSAISGAGTALPPSTSSPSTLDGRASR